MVKHFLCDTNALLDHLDKLDNYSIVLSNFTMRELEKHKQGKGELPYKARKATRYIKNNRDKFIFDTKDYDGSLYGDKSYFDNSILAQVVENNYGLITGDQLLRFRAEGLGIEVIDIDDISGNEEVYDGVREVYINPSELNEINQNLDNNKWNLLVNEYIILFDEVTGGELDCFKWDGSLLHRVNGKGFNSNQFGKFKPYDFYQQCAVDSIRSNDITNIKGKAGSGKSLIALSTAWHMIEKGYYDRLIIFTNPVKTRNAQELGFYTGDRTEKLMQSSIGVMLTSKFGKESEVESQILNGRLSLLPFSDIRGFDTSSEQKTIVFITEAQNLNSDLLKLGLQRLGSNTKAIVDGDPNTQVDMDAYRIDNGMKRMSEVFRGESLYGEITLKKIYRSPIAEIAERM